MDTRNRPADEWEQQAALQDWLTWLDTIGINTAKVFANEHDLIRKSLQINVNWDRYKAEKPDSLNDAARKAVTDPDDYTSFVDILVAGALAADPAVHERMRTVVGRAGALAAGNSYRAFRQRGEGLYKIIAPLVQKTARGIAEVGATLPAGVLDLDVAARVGVEQDWLKLERLVADWDVIVKLLDAWYSAGVFDVGGREIDRYTATMFLFEDYEQSIATYGVEPLRTMRQIMTCEPALLTLDQVDELGSNNVTRDAFNRNHSSEQLDDDRTARKALIDSH